MEPAYFGTEQFTRPRSRV